MKGEQAGSNIWKYVSHVAGPITAIFGGTHGDERSGVEAVRQLINDFETGSRVLLKGTLCLVLANEKAINFNRRYIKHNLNRLYRERYSSEIDMTSYEYKRAQELKKILSQCTYFLDLHAAPIAEEPFLILEEDHARHFLHIGVEKIIVEWEKLSVENILGAGDIYASRHGAIAATYKSGNYYDKASFERAYEVSLRFLGGLGHVAYEHVSSKEFKPQVFQMYEVVNKNASNFEYAFPVRNFMFIPRGGVFAREGGKEISVSEDSYILIPMEPRKTKVGEEVCYLGRLMGQN